MSTLSIALMLTFGISWGILGALTYAQYADDVPNPSKKLIFRLLCGPVIWFIFAFSYLFEIMLIPFDVAIVKFLDWIRKP